MSVQEGRILVNQLGYRPNDSKIAFVGSFQGESFEVMDLATNKSVFRGKIRSIGTNDVSTGDMTFALDFTQVKMPGKYQLWIPGTSVMSSEFTIAADVYAPAAIASIESFYYQRCGIEVNNGNVWQHPACHTSDGIFFDDPSTPKDVVGGWHDAGDYGKFVATGAESAAFLLYLYEHQSSKFFDGQLSIPEANNKVPDILDEVRWELEWLLKMQRDDGAVFHKVSTKKWTGEYLPHADPDRRYIFNVSSTATGAFAAVAALGARVYEKFDRTFARQLLRSSRLAWEFLETHPTIVPSGGFRNPSGVEGGEYGDRQDSDERLWAATELFRTTGNIEYHRYFLARYKKVGGIHYPVSWQRVQNFAYYSYLLTPRESIDNNARAFIVSTLTRYCDQLLQRIDESGYRYVLKPEEHYWGSNSVALGYAFDLIQAYEITRSGRYLEGALHQFHYMLGRNPFDHTFITGVGINPVRHPYHQFSMMLRARSPVPGLAVGGANQNGRLRGKILSSYPGKCYEDNEKNYFVNEVAINYTAPFAFIAGYLSNLGGEKKSATMMGKR